MKQALWASLVVSVGIYSGQAVAHSIFNVPQTSESERPRQSVPQDATREPRAVQAPRYLGADDHHSKLPVPPGHYYNPELPPAASVVPLTPEELKLIEEYERLPNETDDEYDRRMKVLYEKALKDLKALNEANQQRLRSLNMVP